jgi:hypothetical protein
MPDPIVFISRNRIKPGMSDEFTQHYLTSVPLVLANKPGTLVQLGYLDEDSQETVFVRVFPDADGLDRQLQGADERSKITYQFIEPTSVEVYGNPSAFALEMFQKVAGNGIKVSIFPQYIGGFIRSQPG